MRITEKEPVDKYRRAAEEAWKLSFGRIQKPDKQPPHCGYTAEVSAKPVCPESSPSPLSTVLKVFGAE